MIENAWNTLCLMAPWLLLGATIGGVLHVVLPKNWLRQNFSGPGGVFKAVGFGVPLPLCSCGVIPAGVGLRKQGANDQAAIAFLISTPQTGIDSILVSASFLGWPFALFKVAVAAVTGIVGGLLATDTRTSAEKQGIVDLDRADSPRRGIGEIVAHGYELIQSIWIWIVIGIALSVVIEMWIAPTAWFRTISSGSQWVSMLLVLVVSLPLYVCATASVPVAAALVAAGMPAGAAIVFLIAGPATNMATIGAVYTRFGMRNLLVYLTTLIVGSLAGGWVFDGLIGAGAVPVTETGHHHTGWTPHLFGAVLLAIFARCAWQDLQRFCRARQSKRLPGTSEPTRTFQVSGMTCRNCVAKIESELHQIPGLSAVNVDLAQGMVVVAGSVDADTVRSGIRAAGFTVQ